MNGYCVSGAADQDADSSAALECVRFELEQIIDRRVTRPLTLAETDRYYLLCHEELRLFDVLR